MGMTSNLADKDEINLEEFDDALQDTFAPKKKNDLEIKEEGDEENKEDEAPPVPDAPVVENEMTLTEQLEYAK